MNIAYGRNYTFVCISFVLGCLDKQCPLYRMFISTFRDFVQTQYLLGQIRFPIYLSTTVNFRTGSIQLNRRNLNKAFNKLLTFSITLQMFSVFRAK